MKLQEYIKHLQNLSDKGYKELPVVYSADDEGNRFSPVIYAPIPGYFDGEYFSHEECTEINAVCIN